jgi:hypothetical protein
MWLLGCFHNSLSVLISLSTDSKYVIKLTPGQIKKKQIDRNPYHFVLFFNLDSHILYMHCYYLLMFGRKFINSQCETYCNCNNGLILQLDVWCFLQRMVDTISITSQLIRRLPMVVKKTDNSFSAVSLTNSHWVAKSSCWLYKQWLGLRNLQCWAYGVRQCREHKKKVFFTLFYYAFLFSHLLYFSCVQM